MGMLMTTPYMTKNREVISSCTRFHQHLTVTLWFLARGTHNLMHAVPLNTVWMKDMVRLVNLCSDKRKRENSFCAPLGEFVVLACVQALLYELWTTKDLDCLGVRTPWR